MSDQIAASVDQIYTPKVYTITRDIYDGLLPEDKGNNVFFISEPSSLGENTLSLYLGSTRVSNLMKIADSEIVVTEINSKVVYQFQHPEEFEIPDKIFYYEQKVDAQGQTLAEPQYVLFMYDGENIVKIAGGDGGAPIQVDGVTIKNIGGILTAAAADLEGNAYVVSGTTYTAAKGATAINNYYDATSNTSGNIATPANSIVSGTGNTIVGNTIVGNTIIYGATNSVAFGSGNIINTYGPLNFAIGVSNEIKNGTNYDPTYSASPFGATTIGKQNKLLGAATDSVAIGVLNKTELPLVSDHSSTQANILIGSRNEFSVSATDHNVCKSIIIGNENVLQPDTQTGSSKLNSEHGGLIAIGNRIKCLHNTGSSNTHDEIIAIGNDIGISNTCPGSVLIGTGNKTENSNSKNLHGNVIFLEGGRVSKSIIGGITYLDPERIYNESTSNIITNNGVCLNTDFTSINSNTQNHLVTNVLPANSSVSQLYYRSGSTTDYVFEDITINLNTGVSPSNLCYETWDVNYGVRNVLVSLGSTLGKDYSSTMIFRKSPNTTSATTLMTNFTANDASHIYLLNPDIDITSFDIISIFLFYDGFNLCAIVYGYEEITPV